MISEYVVQIVITPKREEKEMAKIKSQTEAIKRHLIRRKKISSWKAFELYGCTRLSAHIYNLRKEGWAIRSFKITKKNRYGNPVNFVEYHLLSDTICNSKTITM